MVSSQEIIERSFYMSLLRVALENNLTLDPDNYLPTSKESSNRYNEDKQKLEKYIYIFGIGNNHSRGPKEVPRITLELQGYYPSTFGIEKLDIENEGSSSKVIEYDIAPKDTIIDVHLVAENQADMRLLHSIMYAALPSRGYIPPFLGDKEEYMNGKVGPSNNLFISVTNFYDKDELSKGLIEKVYSYTIHNGMILDKVVDEIANINNISVNIQPESSSDDSVVQVSLDENNDT